ncbi:MAG: GTP cyclohydrolase II, partial [Pirellulaceae bacterium]|nr:GTP cyclohydrolase II [Pirellulaceae bacterium]
DQLLEMAKEKNIAIITIEELIAYRRLTEKMVSRSVETKLPTHFGEWKVIVYDVKYETQQPVVLVRGNLAESPQAPLVRMHSSCFTGDLLGSLRCDCGDQLQMALQMIGQEAFGVIVYLPQEGRGIGLVEKLKAYALQDDGLDTVEANQALGFKVDMRDYGIGIQVLKDLGLKEIRLLTNNPKKTEAFNLRGFDLTVVDQVPIIPVVNEHNAAYLTTKRTKMGHILPDQQQD